MGARAVTCHQGLGSQPADPDPIRPQGRRNGVASGSAPIRHHVGAAGRQPPLPESGGARLGDPCCARAALVDDSRIGFFGAHAGPGPRFDARAFGSRTRSSPGGSPAKLAGSARGALAFAGTAANSPRARSSDGGSVSWGTGIRSTASARRIPAVTKPASIRIDASRPPTVGSFRRGSEKPDGGAARGIRTPDPLITNEVLYQLSYCGPSPTGPMHGARQAAPDVGRLLAARPSLGKAGAHRKCRQAPRSAASSSRRNAATSARSTPGAMKLWPMPRARMKVSAPSRTFLSCAIASRIASASPHPPGTA